MSFILDALKKSESERQRQSGPALFEVKVAPPRSRFALWAIALGALLAVNGVVVGWLLVRGPARHAPAEPAAQETAAPLPAARSPAAFAGVAEPAAAVSPAPTPQPLPGPGSALTQSVVPPPAPVSDAASSISPAAPDAQDLAPAVEPARAAPPADDGVIRATASGLPTYQDAAAAPGANMPELRLDLHAYSAQPGQSFVSLNNKLLHEGDSLPEGVRVEKITPDGVILSYRGSKFVLQKQ